jgi:hypothetical protein
MRAYRKAVRIAENAAAPTFEKNIKLKNNLCFIGIRFVS